VLAWLSVWSEVQMICIWSSWCHCHPIISCFIKILNGSAFLVPAYPGCPGKEVMKWLWYCICICVSVYICVCYQRRVSVSVATCVNLITALIRLSLTTCCRDNHCHLSNHHHWQPQQYPSHRHCQVLLTDKITRQNDLWQMIIVASDCATKNCRLVTDLWFWSYLTIWLWTESAAVLILTSCLFTAQTLGWPSEPPTLNCSKHG